MNRELLALFFGGCGYTAPQLPSHDRGIEVLSANGFRRGHRLAVSCGAVSVGAGRIRVAAYFSALLFSAIASAGIVNAQDSTKGPALPPSSSHIYVARQIITMNPQQPTAKAVAVAEGKIIGVGTEQEMIALVGRGAQIDRRFEQQVLLPGFIEPHIHPILSALSLTSEIVSIEEWVLPDGSIHPAVRDRESYLRRLRDVEQSLDDGPEPLLSWGFHHYFHGKLTRSDLDAISKSRPIVIWHRSAHEFVLNSLALELVGLDAAALASASDLARRQVDLATGHFWEAGAMDFLLPRLLPLIIGKLTPGLELTERYLHQAGITTAAEPGGLAAFYRPQIQVLGDADTPFRFYFIADGRSLAQAHAGQALLDATEHEMPAETGRTALLPRQVKLFADGAIFSQLMQLREGYLDGHHGEWMMEETVYRGAFRTYWEAGYQIHVHQNGDKGLDRVIDVLRENLKRHPREDHRTTIVHFGFATPSQVKALAELGAIVSANPYYVTALADKYSEFGVGAARAQTMVRLRDVVEQGIPLSLHSDMPMAPARPLFLAWAAVNRTTFSGRQAAPDLALSVQDALQAITLGAAYALRLENEIGSIEVGKRADFTALAASPFEVAKGELKDIVVTATVSEGRVFELSP